MSDYTDGLRRLAEWLDEHPEHTPSPIHALFYVGGYRQSPGEIIESVREIGATFPSPRNDHSSMYSGIVDDTTFAPHSIHVETPTEKLIVEPAPAIDFLADPKVGA